MGGTSQSGSANDAGGGGVRPHSQDSQRNELGDWRTEGRGGKTRTQAHNTPRPDTEARSLASEQHHGRINRANAVARRESYESVVAFGQQRRCFDSRRRTGSEAGTESEVTGNFTAQRWRKRDRTLETLRVCDSTRTSLFFQGVSKCGIGCDLKYPAVIGLLRPSRDRS